MTVEVSLGETVDVCAIWLDGTESAELRRQFEADVAEALRTTEQQRSVRLGPVRWVELKPGEPRVPDVPNHIAGPSVRLLLGEATVIGFRYGKKAEVGFVHDLEPDDLKRLRRITRDAYARRFPGRGPLTDRQCETLINDLGPDAAIETLRGRRSYEIH